MTDDDRQAFAQAMSRLCVALREKEPDVAQYRVYYETLAEHEIEFVVEAARQLQHRAQWFPKASEWSELARQIETATLEKQRDLLRKADAPLCAECDDTWWKPLQVVENGLPVRRVTRCECQAQRRQELLGRAPLPQLTGKK